MTCNTSKTTGWSFPLSANESPMLTISQWFPLFRRFLLGRPLCLPRLPPTFKLIHNLSFSGTSTKLSFANLTSRKLYAGNKWWRNFMPHKRPNKNHLQIVRLVSETLCESTATTRDKTELSRPHKSENKKVKFALIYIIKILNEFSYLIPF